jgi:signal transduction histidine kinase
LLPGDCLYTLGPAAVLVAAQVTGPDWGDWPLYLAALVAQLGADFAGGTVRGWLALGVPPALHLRTLIFVWAIDAALSPVGLLAAFASASWRFAFLGVLPLASLLVVLSHERTRRLASELAATREREALIAGASHELQTPLAILSGLIESLARNPGTPEERRAASLASMERQAGHLRYLVGQFVDYALVKAGRELLVHTRRTEVGPVLESVSSLWAPEVQVVVTGAATEAVVDATRLHRVVMSLVANAVKYGPPQGPVSISARTEDGAVVVEIADQGPGLRDDQLDAIFGEFRELADRPEGLGVGLFLARASLHAQGGAIRLRNAAGGGLVAELRVPAHAG